MFYRGCNVPVYGTFKDSHSTLIKKQTLANDICISSCSYVAGSPSIQANDQSVNVNVCVISLYFLFSIKRSHLKKTAFLLHFDSIHESNLFCWWPTDRLTCTGTHSENKDRDTWDSPVVWVVTPTSASSSCLPHVEALYLPGASLASLYRLSRVWTTPLQRASQSCENRMVINENSDHIPICGPLESLQTWA